MITELKYASRRLIKSPGFTLVAIAILALGIASNTAVFSVVEALLLRGLPVRDPGSLVLIRTKPGAGDNDDFSYPAFEEFRDHAQSLTGVVAVDTLGRSMVIGGPGQENVVGVKGCAVSGNFFPLLGIPAALGRTLVPDDDKFKAARPVIVLSYDFWKRQFGGDPSVIGRFVRIDNAQVMIVGVAKADFFGVEPGDDIDLWLPLNLDPILNPDRAQKFEGPAAPANFWLYVMGRLRPGYDRTAAASELDLLFHRHLLSVGISAENHAAGEIGKVLVEPGGSGYVDRATTESLLHTLLALVALVLVVACANVASLLLARAASRQREFALRAALGAGRARLIREFITESMLLSLAGGVVGLFVAHFGTLWIATYLFPWGHASIEFGPDGGVLLFTAAAVIVTGLMVGVVPAVRVSRLDVGAAMKQQSTAVTGGASQKLNKVLVAAQIALSICLLAGAGLFVRTLQKLSSSNLGFNKQNLIVVYFPFDKGDDLTRRASVSTDLQAALQARPGVRASTFSWAGGGVLAGGGTYRSLDFSVVGYDRALGQPLLHSSITYVGPQFLETLGVPLIRGRTLKSVDIFPPGGQSPAARPDKIVVNEAFARRFFGARDPIGRQIHIPDDRSAALAKIVPVAYQIVGVVGDTKTMDLREDHPLEIYAPCTAMVAKPNGLFLEVRTLGDAAAFAPDIRSVIQRIYPKMQSPLFMTTKETIDRALFQEKTLAQTAGGFSLFALFLASLGLYGVLAYNVAQRTREIGIRMALGAQSGNVVSLFLRQGMGLAAVGCVIGTVAAMGLAQLISRRLYGISAIDPLTFLATALVLLSIAFFACWLPARRATKVDPIIALRAE